MKLDSINGVLCILISTVKRGFGEISNRVSRKIRLHRDPSNSGENSINFELNFVGWLVSSLIMHGASVTSLASGAVHLEVLDD